MGNAVVEIGAHHGRRDHVRHPADVIGVIVRRDDQIERVVVMRLQVGDDGRRAGAGIDQNSLPLRGDDERGIALTDIEEAQLQRLRVDGTDKQEAAEDDDGQLAQ